MNEFFDLLQRASLFGVAALGVALLLQWVLSHRVPARWRVWVWRVALVQTALALIPFAPIALAVLPARAPVAAPKIIEASATQAPILAESPAVAASPDITVPPAELSPPAMLEAPAIQSAPTTRPRYSFDIKLSPREFAVWIYLLGVALQIALLGRNIVRVRRALGACTPLDSAPLRPIATRLKIRRLPRLLQSANGSPFLVGIMRPTIVVPQTLNSAHLEAVFAHELAHHKRRDLTWNALLWALQTALWFHPLSWFSRRYHALEVESACDELTLQLTQIAPKSYGALLIGAETSQTSPLTAGVNDHFFALQTRLKRLSRAPMQPRRRTAWLLCAALCVSFAAVVPIKLTARAQSEQKAAQLSGIVKDQRGNAVANATVYLTRKNSAEPLETTTSDADGRFEFSSAIEDNRRILVWADAGARGLGQSTISQGKSGVRLSNPVVAPRAPVKLLFVAPNGKRAANLRVRVGQIGPTPDEQWIVPRPLAQALQTQTNARGEAVFAGLPKGQIAQFWLSDQTFRPTQIGFGDLRGGQYAPLDTKDAVEIGKAKGWKTIRLVAPVTLQGRVTTPAGIGKSGALVLAQPISFNSSRQFDGAMMIAQTRADANGDYKIKGLRPAQYLVEVEVESEPWLARDYASHVRIEDLKAPVERIDLSLIRGGVVRGVILQKGTNKPLAERAIALLDGSRKYQYQETDARGRFQFRSVGGMAYLWTQNDNIKWPAKFLNTGELAFEAAKAEFYEEKAGQFVWDNVMTDATIKVSPRNYVSWRADSVISASDLVLLPVKEGATRDITIESAIKPVVKPVTGAVVGPDGRGVAGAAITIRDVTSPNYISWRGLVKSDARGRFTIPPQLVRNAGVRLLASNSDLTLATLRVTVATSGDNITLTLERDVAAAIEGQIVDKITGKPIAGVQVLCHSPVMRASNATTTMQTDAQGRFRFENLRPFEVSFL